MVYLNSLVGKCNSLDDNFFMVSQIWVMKFELVNSNSSFSWSLRIEKRDNKLLVCSILLVFCQTFCICMKFCPYWIFFLDPQRETNTLFCFNILLVFLPDLFCIFNHFVCSFSIKGVEMVDQIILLFYIVLYCT